MLKVKLSSNSQRAITASAESGAQLFQGQKGSPVHLHHNPSFKKVSISSGIRSVYWEFENKSEIHQESSYSP